MKLANISVQIGGFHDHWLRNGTDTPAVLIAAVTKYHYDFICLMDKEYEKKDDIKKQIEAWIPGFKVHLGEERMYDWGHIVSVMNDDAPVNLQNADFFDELSAAKKHNGIVALAHICHPTSKKSIMDTHRLDELIDGNFVDAVQFEKESEYEYIRERVESGKKTALISGWDSHMLNDRKDMPKILYDENYDVKDHFDHSSMFRTIVFADDNSFNSIKNALAEGKSIVEDTETGKFYGNRELIHLLIDNGYREKIKQLDEEYYSVKMQCNSLTAYSKGEFKFPSAGKVKIATGTHNIPSEFKTDDEGGFSIQKLPMPVNHDESFITVFWSDGKRSRYFAVRIKNNISFDTFIKYKNNKTILEIVSKNAFSGKLLIKSPVEKEFDLCCNAGTVTEIQINDDEKTVNYSYTVYDKDNSRDFSGRLALAIAHRFNNNNWNEAEEILIDDERYCGGFGSIRPYPGKDVFSIKVKFLWDEENLYVRYDITDKIYIMPPKGEYMFMSDSTTLNIDPYHLRSHSRSSGCELILGFPDDEPHIVCTHAPRDESDIPFFGRKINSEIEGNMTMTKTQYGRIVTTQIPWSQISTMVPKCDTYIGFTVGGLNDDGGGLVDNMQWPWPPKSWLFPCDWGTMLLTE